MLTAARLKIILEIAVPIILGMLSQTLLNLVDTSMVRGLGNAALAAVGHASFANFVAGAPIMGLSAGVQAMAARRMGEGAAERAAHPLNGGLLVCLLFGLPWVLAIALSASWWFPRLVHSEQVATLGAPYLYCRLTATVLVGMHFSFRAFWTATGRSKVYMLNLLGMHLLNILLNWVLIYGNLGAPALGLLGAGIANATASFVGVTTHFVLASRLARHQGFLHGLPTRDTLATMLRVSLPTSAQQFFFAAGMTTLMALLARAGTGVAAASKVLLDLILAGLLPAMGLGMAGTTLVGQALGRNDLADAKRWGWQVSQTAFVGVLAISLPVIAFPDRVLAQFLSDPQTIAMTRASLRLVASTAAIDAVGMVLQNCLIGAGDSRRVMLASLGLQYGLILPAVALLVLRFDLGMLSVWTIQAGVRSLQAILFAAMWQRDKWQGIRI